MTMPVTLRTQTSPRPQFPPGSGVLMRPVGLSSSGFARSMAALALPLRALEEREGPLALLMSAFALQIGTFARHIGAFALSIGTFALFIGAFALFIGTFALFIGAFALFMSAHEERERSTNYPVRGGEKRMKPPVEPVRAHRGPRMIDPSPIGPRVAVSIDLCKAQPGSLEGVISMGLVRRFTAIRVCRPDLSCTASVRVVP
jgi:hypothetical protein